MNLDRSAYLREVLKKGFLLDKQERVLKDYAGGKLTLIEACHRLKCDRWEILSLLETKSAYLSVRLEDWLESAELESSAS